VHNAYHFCSRPARFLITILIGFLNTLGGLAQPSPATEHLGKVDPVPADVLLVEDFFRGRPVQRGLLTVSERHDAHNDGAIGIGFLRFVATGAAAAPPLFILPGGPAWSMRDLGDDFLAQVPIFAVIDRLRQYQDVVVIEQRGYRHSIPSLDCVGLTSYEGMLRNGQDEIEAIRQTGAECHGAWLARGADLAAFTVREAAADVDALRTALDYQEINLLGNSFGSHWAMAVMRYYPEPISTALIAGVEGPDHTFDVPSEVLGSLARLASVAEEDAALVHRIPEDGLLGALQAVIRRLENMPGGVVYSTTSDGKLVDINAEDIRQMARGFPYIDTAEKAGLWPAMVLELYAGNYRSAADFSLRRRHFSPWHGLFSAMDCASGASEPRRRLLTDDAARELISDINRRYLTACEIWNDADMGDDFRSGFRSGIPTVIVQGDWDISTPPENALSIRHFFTNHYYVGIQYGTHRELWATLYRNEEFLRSVQHFLSSGSFDTMPEHLVAPIPEFTKPDLPHDDVRERKPVISG